MTNKNVELEINLLEELSDADLMAVVGGGGTDTVGTLASDLTNTLANAGNGSHPTSSGVTLVGGILTAAGNYTSNNVGGFSEGTLQGTNKTLVDTGNAV